MGFAQDCMSLVCVMNETTQNHDDEKSFSIAEHAI